jgi:hypothetical protein
MDVKTDSKNLGYTSVTVQILNVQIRIVCIFMNFLGAVLWALINQGSKFHSKKIVTGPRVSVSSQYQKDNR